MTTQQPAALRLANVCSNLTRYSMDAHLIAAELRRQHARITELEAQLAQRFDAADMATAAAQGFRDGVASLTAQVAESAIENCPELNMGNYDEVDVERLNDWAIRANDEIDRLHALAAGQATTAQAVVLDDVAALVRAAQAFLLEPDSHKKRLELDAMAWGPLAAATQPETQAVPSDEIIAMANEAGLNSYRIAPSEAVAVWSRFAALVAAKEREACKQDDDLILQMLGALEEAIELLDVISPFEDDTTRKARKAIAAARKWLEGTP